MALNLGNQTLGRGEIHASLFRTGTHTPAGFRYLGNSPSFSLTISQDKLDHFSSDRGVRVKDKSVILQVDYTGNLTLDDINNDNLALFFFGSKSVFAQTSATLVSETFTDVAQGYGYQLGITDATPTGVRKISNVAVKIATVAQVAGVDYTFDADRGIITVTEGGAIEDGADIIVTYDRAAVSYDQVISGTDQVECALRFISYNPEGERNDYYLPYCRLGPNGDFQLKSDDWQSLPLTVEILADTAYGRSAIYIDGQPYTPA